MIPIQKYGLKTIKPGRNPESTDRRDYGFTSATATYMLAKAITARVNANPYIVVHNLGYVPRVLVFEILSDHNRKLPYDDSNFKRDFSITKNEVKIRGVTSGIFKIFIFAQGIL